MAPAATVSKIKSLRMKIEIVQDGLAEIEEELQAAVVSNSRLEISLKLALLEERWRRHEGYLDKLSELVDSLGTADGEREAQELCAELNAIEVKRMRLRLSAKRQLEDSNLGSSAGSGANGQPPVPHLPHLPYRTPTMKTFSGDIFEWPTFWERFEANIHRHPSMPIVAKFAELDRCLEGVAAAAIAGLKRQEAHYQTAIDVLAERFGNKSAIVDRLMGELFDLPAVKDDNVPKLRDLLDGISTRVRMLENLGRTESTYVDIIRPRLITKLPAAIGIDWHERADCDSAELKVFIDFLQKKVQSRERWLLSQPGSIVSSKGNRDSRDHQSRGERSRIDQERRVPSTASALLNKVPTKSNAYQRSCPFCEQDHKPVDCDSELSRRVEITKEKRRCFNCLGTGHRLANCESRSRCGRCGRRHHTSLCGGGNSSNGTSQREATGVASRVTNLLAFQPPTEILLQTATPLLIASESQKIRVLCLLDLGSQRTMIRRQLAEELKLKFVGKELISFIGIGGSQSTPKWSKRRQVKIQGAYSGADEVEVEAIDIERIATVNSVTPNRLAAEMAKNGYQLADDRFAVPSPAPRTDEEIDLLIGADVYWQLVEKDRVADDKGLAAVKSKIGWLLSGPVQRIVCGRSPQATSLIIQALERPELQTNIELESSEEERVDKLREDIENLTAFFELEHIGIRTAEAEPTAATLCSDYALLIRRSEDGRFQLPLPWNNNKDRLTSNRGLAECRLRSLLRKLNADRHLLLEYNEQIQDFLRQGWISPVNEHSGELDNYLPHLPVVRREKRSTKLRIVFDASAKQRGKLCLNDCVYTGDNLYPDMLAIILRFGRHPVAWIGDVTKAFPQLELRPADRPACKFLWIDDLDDPLAANVVTFQWNRVTFGISCSPFLLAVSIRKLLQEHQDSYPDTAASILENTFVDDWAEGAESVAVAAKRIREAVEIFDHGKLSIGKWLTNSHELHTELTTAGLSSVESADGHVADLLMGEQSKILGLRWNTSNDCYFFDPSAVLEFERSLSGPLTKRRLIKVAAKLFDPVGYLSPLIINAKVLFQELWKEKLDWDDPVPGRVREQWRVFIDGLPMIKKIRIPRYIYSHGQGRPLNQELHVFCDASKVAYGTVAYLRIEYESGEVSVRFVASKSRVAPLKSLTIPRLELLAALLGARLLTYLQKNLRLDQGDAFLWSDSTVVCAWMLQENRAKLMQWVRNRVEEAAQLIPSSHWRHCPGVCNPADLVSRGVQAAQLVDSSVWWHGPAWLVLDETEWPNSQQMPSLSNDEAREVQDEMREAFRAMPVVAAEPMDWSRFSSYEKAVRVTAWILRFVKHCKSGKPGHSEDHIEDSILNGNVCFSVPRLQRSELIEAEIVMLRAAQRERFADEFEQLQQGSKICRKSSLVGLRPVFDRDRMLMRVTGRVEESFNILGIEPPILLPNNHAVVDLLVNDVHLRLKHMGFRTTFAELKNRFWIVKGGALVKKLIKSCVICSREHSRSYQEAAASLPPDRVRRARPFQITGLDYAGPLLIRSTLSRKRCREASNEDIIKAYFLIFSCAVTRALWLELVPDLGTENFIDALRRFQAGTHGSVSLIISDNARTFRKASRYLSRLQFSKKVHAHLQMSRIDWKFNACRAPWWGGFFERMVQTVKGSLRKTLQRTSLSWIQLATVLKEIEFAINKRPLTYVDAEQLTPLTPDRMRSGVVGPGDFIEAQLVAGADLSSQDSLTRHEKARVDTLECWWRRWQSEYLHDLNHFRTPSRSGRRIEVGDIVLIHEDKKRLLWRSGLVVKLHRGRDGLARSADVRTAGRVLTRPVQRLYPTEVRAEQEVGSVREQSHSPAGGEVNNGSRDESRSSQPVSEDEPVEASVSPGEDVGNTEDLQRTTRRGRRVRLPARFR